MGNMAALSYYAVPMSLWPRFLYAVLCLVCFLRAPLGGRLVLYGFWPAFLTVALASIFLLHGTAFGPHFLTVDY